MRKKRCPYCQNLIISDLRVRSGRKPVRLLPARGG